ncbi:hypothetical protein EIP91_000878 [Steccherinum ochraceum]|uniref:Uncharacterized protein n=1 Tax=Steccherinum ochraceum TaxID=92696 RepID=A0A4R0RQ20_9APHY|nr:hypothetical protein EIP91_000878 [Steccherinum ochraceum]
MAGNPQPGAHPILFLALQLRLFHFNLDDDLFVHWTIRETMRFTSIFTGVLTISFATVFALPIPPQAISSESSKRDGLIAHGNHWQPALIRRDIDFHITRDDLADLVLRDVLGALSGRDSEARVDEPVPNGHNDGLKKRSKKWFGRMSLPKLPPSISKLPSTMSKLPSTISKAATGLTSGVKKSWKKVFGPKTAAPPPARPASIASHPPSSPAPRPASPPAASPSASERPASPTPTLTPTSSSPKPPRLSRFKEGPME